MRTKSSCSYTFQLGLLHLQILHQTMNIITSAAVTLTFSLCFILLKLLSCRKFFFKFLWIVLCSFLSKPNHCHQEMEFKFGNLRNHHQLLQHCGKCLSFLSTHDTSRLFMATFPGYNWQQDFKSRIQNNQ